MICPCRSVGRRWHEQSSEGGRNQNESKKTAPGLANVSYCLAGVYRSRYTPWDFERRKSPARSRILPPEHYCNLLEMGNLRICLRGEIFTGHSFNLVRNMLCKSRI